MSMQLVKEEEGKGAAFWGQKYKISNLLLGQWVLSKAPTAPMLVVGVLLGYIDKARLDGQDYGSAGMG